MLDKSYDVIVVGAGFSGLTAARELSKKGYKTLILEGRDRMGGRTWFDDRMGRNLEMGGTYVHWFQPHIWAEISRYNLEVQKVPDLNSAYWIADDKLNIGTEDEMFKKINEGMEVFLKDAKKYFPRPYEPFYNENIEEIDHLSVEDRLEEIKQEISKESYDLLRNEWSAYFCTDDLDKPGLTQAYRWLALSDYDWYTMEDIFELYKFKNGTKSLIDSIFNDGESEIKLSTPVSAITKTDNGHKITTRNGEEFTSKAVVAAIPINVINNIDFEPKLLDEKHQISDEKQTTEKGGKLWAKVRGFQDTSLFSGPEKYPVSSMHTDSIDGDVAYVMGYVGNVEKLDMENTEEVEDLLRHWIPDLEVIESTGHNWTDDEFSKGTWPVLKKNQLTKYGKALRKSEDGLYLAGSDYADGWAGFMDGAIESGLTTADRVSKYLLKDKED